MLAMAASACKIYYTNREVMSDPLLTIGALTDHYFTPSSRFRVRQLVLPLQSRRISLIDFPRKYSTQNLHNFRPHLRIRESVLKLGYAAVQEIANFVQTAARLYSVSDFDYTLVSREVLIGYPSFERFISNKLIYDLDDAVFLTSAVNARKTRRLIEAASVVFAGNDYLASWCRNYSPNVHVLPTAVDTNRFLPNPERSSSVFVVGWSGTSSAFKYLASIEDQLLHFFETHDDAVFMVCSDRYPAQLTKLAKYLRFELWSERDEVRQIQKFSVGIMPTASDDWALGKCSYKMLLYLSCGVPCCVTEWGMNIDVLARGRVGVGVGDANEWCDALEFMYKSHLELDALFPDCRAVVESHYSVSVITDRFANVVEQ